MDFNSVESWDVITACRTASDLFSTWQCRANWQSVCWQCRSYLALFASMRLCWVMLWILFVAEAPTEIQTFVFSKSVQFYPSRSISSYIIYIIYIYNSLYWEAQQIAWPSPLFEKNTSSEDNIIHWDETASTKLFLCRTNLKLAKGSHEELHGSCLAPRACTGHSRKDHVAQILHCCDLVRLIYLDLPTDRGHFAQSSSRLHVAIPVHHAQHSQKRVWEILATCHATASISWEGWQDSVPRQTYIHTCQREHIASALMFCSMTTNGAMSIQHGVFWCAAMHAQPLCFEDVACYWFFQYFYAPNSFCL